jgi:hypothetical protein
MDTYMKMNKDTDAHIDMAMYVHQIIGLWTIGTELF